MSTPDPIVITGGKKLSGTVEVSGSKNAALPLLAATLLTQKPCTLSRIPRISDVANLLTIIQGLGGTVSRKQNTVTLATKNIITHIPDPVLVEKLRGSVLILGPLLARVGKASLHFPGGCNLGDRNLHTHLDAFIQMGVKVATTKTSYQLTAPKAWPKARRVVMHEMSVTATENIAMLASALSGTTIIELASFEPEVVAVCHFLEKLGAKITGIGTPTLKITGQSKPKGANHTNIYDRIEAATLAAAAVITHGQITIKGYVANDLVFVTKKFLEMGVAMQQLSATSMQVRAPKILKPVSIQTNIFPNFPTDLQPIFGVLATQAQGQSHIAELMYSNRFNYLEILAKQGAKAQINHNHFATITGPTPISGGEAAMPDIRGGAALLLAGLTTTQPITITQTRFLDRGYEDIISKLRKLGANISA